MECEIGLASTLNENIIPKIKVPIRWNTGSDISMISNKVINLLNLISNEIVNINDTNFNVYNISVFLTPSIIFDGIRVIAVNIGAEIDLLIGMDIISQGDFMISNFNNKTSFSFGMPSDINMNHIGD